ncbi:TPA: hypothetical protein J4786_003288 [Citrobacter amalonaticus]|nr:hypothetical protein [Citrobacter amalonaticus]HAZ4787842.1 hypothetical protein [Citrobacter amalonaticus]
MHTTAQLANQNEQERTFDRLDTEVKRLTTLTAEDGTKIPFTGNMKIVYSYLYTFYTNEKRLNYPDPIYPNMRLIAEENGITLPTAQKCINSLVNAGVLIKDSIQVKAGFESNNYIVMLPAEVVARNKTPETQPKPTKQKPDLRIVHNEEKPDEQQTEPCACVAPVQALPDPIQTTDQQAGDVPPDPSVECVDVLDDVPLTDAPEGVDEVKAPSALTLNENEIEIASLQNQHSEVEEKIRKFDWWLKGKDVEKMIRFAGDYGLTRESPQAIRDLVTEKRENAVKLKNRLEIELESHDVFDHIAEGVY